MLYIDQLINTGFSYGSPNFNSTFNAAPYVYTFLQKCVQDFPQYKPRELSVFGESYGGHWIYYAEYIAEQNDLIKAGKLNATPLNLAYVGLNNAWYNPILQMKAHVDYSYTNG
ncbi:hypothetical protein CLAFUW4_03411 [Fulvia fulva]|uniref:Carboxypeptidase n=1 Tax=Passalora fulva TaxID=5499 RepID=UPI0004EA0E07|nr:Carboxypeptidase [Fulvia fulva]KAK4632133.1 hypothetical protein CLAFUR4_03400 [Fulvia fulva]KAK4633603.1 hypothetical protein CLAFUR0_03405 [Fulvia fulva]WMI38795.1 Carboxypeptidase [Fulvia fulva]WPV10569.1 hypothetical protein CLAFUW4_03411 [Fulvia fulva]WPV26542.1 hypothetical protein CLAFUW7_03403 [Fulvia fulva]